MMRAMMLVLCLCAGAWADGLVVQGRAVVRPDNQGADPLQGQELLLGLEAAAYPFPAGPVSLQAISSSAQDSGWVVATLLTSAYVERVDSVLIHGGASAGFSGTWLRVNAFAFRGAASNAGYVRLYHGAPVADSTLALIPPGRRVAQVPYTQPAGRTQLIPIAWVVEAATTSPDSHASGAVGLKARRPGQAWELLDEVLFVSGAPVVRDYGWRPDGNWETRWPVPAGTDLLPAAGVTAAETDINSRLQVGAR